VALRLSQRGSGKVLAVLDRAPVSPLLQEAIKSNKVQVVLTERVESQEQMTSLLSSKTVVVIGDDGDDELRGVAKEDGVKVLGETYWDTLKAKEAAASIKMLDKTLGALPTSIKGLVCVVSAASAAAASSSPIPDVFSKVAGGGGGAGLSKYAQFCATNNIPFSAFRFGKLTGGVDGAEPLPFVGLPGLEPELHPSVVNRGVVLTSPTANQYAATELCTRGALAEAVVRKLTTQSAGSAVDALVVSIEGSAPTDREWDAQFQRMQKGSNVELLRIDFGEVKKPAALANWLVDSWFPQAIIDADAATILTGARPVRAKKMNDALVRIAWEELAADLSVRAAGGLDINISSSGAAPAITVVRSGGSGDRLPGEVQLIDRLLEGINKQAYKKGLATPASN